MKRDLSSRDDQQSWNETCCFRRKFNLISRAYFPRKVQFQIPPLFSPDSNMIYTALDAINLPKHRHIFLDIVYCQGCTSESDTPIVSLSLSPSLSRKKTKRKGKRRISFLWNETQWGSNHNCNLSLIIFLSKELANRFNNRNNYYTCREIINSLTYFKVRKMLVSFHGTYKDAVHSLRLLHAHSGFVHSTSAES